MIDNWQVGISKARKADIREYLQARACFQQHRDRFQRQYADERQMLGRRVIEVARGLEIQASGPEIGNRQRYGPWRWISDTHIGVRVDDSFMGDVCIKERVFHVRHLLR